MRNIVFLPKPGHFFAFSYRKFVLLCEQHCFPAPASGEAAYKRAGLCGRTHRSTHEAEELRRRAKTGHMRPCFCPLLVFCFPCRAFASRVARLLRVSRICFACRAFALRDCTGSSAPPISVVGPILSREQNKKLYNAAYINQAFMQKLINHTKRLGTMQKN